MQAFIYGGSGSGKSALAERLAQRLSGAQGLYYIATMRPEGAEARRRIRRHRAMRAHKGFTTIELYTGLEGLRLPPGGTVLLECLGNLAANEMFSREGAGEKAAEALRRGLAALRGQAAQLIIVSNDVGGDGVAYAPETQAFQLLLAGLNAELCAQSDLAAEMVCGIPIFLKGEALCPSCVR